MSRRGWLPPEDPSVAPVEEILEEAASRSAGQAERRHGRLVVTHAIWLCACETMNESPLWLIYAVGENRIGWERIPHGTDLADVVEAEHLTGDHPDPAGVLDWLHGKRADPRGGRGQFPQHSYIYEELRRRIRSN